MNKNESPSIRPYVIGFSLSIVLTLAAYFLVQAHVNAAHAFISHEVLIPAILVLAMAQLIVQLLFFLHLGASGTASRWKLGAFVLTVVLVLIVVVGSIWIMNHLNYNMTPSQIDQYLQQQQGGF